MRRLALSIALLASACSGSDELQCGGAGNAGDSLDGSYCEDVPIAFTAADVLRQQGSADEYFIFIQYVDGTTPTVDGPRKVLEILIPSSGVVIEPAKLIPIRMVQGARVRRFPAAEEGNIQAIDLTAELQDSSQVTFDEFTATVGSNASGMFSLLFQSGRTLSGTFQGAIADKNPMM